jgi:hypothetical protein
MGRNPWHHMGRLKGIGVDCAMLLAEVYERAGVIGRVYVEPYPMQWHLHRDDERLMEIVNSMRTRSAQTPSPATCCW